MANVLIIEDDYDIRVYFQKILERHGYAVSSAADGNEGLKKFWRDSFDVVITDMLMPEKDGVEVIQAIRERDKDIPIIAMSGGGSHPEFAAGYLNIAEQLGASITFAKPVDPEHILQAVRELLDYSKLRT